MSERTEQLRRDVAKEIDKLIANPGAASTWFGKDGANTALRLAEPIIEELEREVAAKTPRHLTDDEIDSRTVAAWDTPSLSTSERMFRIRKIVRECIKEAGRLHGPTAENVYNMATSHGHVAFAEWYAAWMASATDTIKHREDEFVAAHKRIAELETIKTRLEDGNMRMASEIIDLKKERIALTADRDMYDRTSTYWWREWHAASGRTRPDATDASVSEACKRMDEQDREVERLRAKLAAKPDQEKRRPAWPAASTEAQEHGWTIDPTFIGKFGASAAGDLDGWEIEGILLAASRLLDELNETPKEPTPEEVILDAKHTLMLANKSQSEKVDRLIAVAESLLAEKHEQEKA